MPPITLTTTVGGTQSNSYCTVAEFIAYMDRIPDAYKTAFISADEYLRSQVLVWATRLLDDNIIYSSNSYRHSEFQSLQFPRFGILDQDGWIVSELSIPRFIKDATCQLAFELLKADLSTEPTRGLESLSVGPISLAFDTNHANDARLIPRSVLNIVAPYGGVLRGQARIRSVPLYRS